MNSENLGIRQYIPQSDQLVVESHLYTGTGSIFGDIVLQNSEISNISLGRFGNTYSGFEPNIKVLEELVYMSTQNGGICSSIDLLACHLLCVEGGPNPEHIPSNYCIMLAEVQFEHSGHDETRRA